MKKTTLIILSDIHGNKYNMEILADRVNADYIMILGDITSFGTLDMATEILDIANSIADIGGYFVPGNCDPMDLFNVDALGRIYNAHGRSIEDTTLNACIYGLGGRNLGVDIYKNLLKGMRCSGFKIVITHIPPYGTKVDKLFWGGHGGREDIREFVEKLKPRIVFSGHIHEARGIDKIGDIILVNPGPFEEGYYATCVLSGDEVDIMLLRLY